MLLKRDKLINLLHAKLNSQLDEIEIKGICVDSREIKNEDMFIALKGDNVDGHDFVQSALKNGASFALVEKDINNVDKSRLIQVNSCYEALLTLAKYNLSLIQSKYIGVTGSIGKTTTKNLIYHLLQNTTSRNVYVSRKNFNSQIGLPICVATMPMQTQIGIFEMGMSHKGEIKKLIEIISPNVSVITYVCETHLEFFNSVWDIAKAKSEIMETSFPQEAIILPADNAYCEFFIRKAKQNNIKNIYTFGFNSANAQVNSYQIEDDNIFVNARVLGNTINYKISGHNISLIPNSLASILAAYAISGISVKILAESLSNFTISSGRGNIFQKNDILIIDDSYNACPTSVKAAIRTLSTYRGRKILVLGDMKELGRQEVQLHENLAATVEKYGINHVFACGNLMKHLFNNIQDSRKEAWSDNSENLKEKVISFIKPGDKILVKGSHSMHMDKIVEGIKNAL